jgi:hypothetical protein
MYIEHIGTMSVKNCNNGMICPVEFKQAGWGNSGKHEVNGKVYLKEGDSKVQATLNGKWTDSIKYKIGSSDEQLLW